jgi:hypothetical protein
VNSGCVGLGGQEAGDGEAYVPRGASGVSVGVVFVCGGRASRVSIKGPQQDWPRGKSGDGAPLRRCPSPSPRPAPIDSCVLGFSIMPLRGGREARHCLGRALR